MMESQSWVPLYDRDLRHERDNQFKLFSQESTIIDVWQGSKYASEQCSL